MFDALYEHLGTNTPTKREVIEVMQFIDELHVVAAKKLLEMDPDIEDLEYILTCCNDDSTKAAAAKIAIHSLHLKSEDVVGIASMMQENCQNLDQIYSEAINQPLSNDWLQAILMGCSGEIWKKAAEVLMRQSPNSEELDTIISSHHDESEEIVRQASAMLAAKQS